MMRAMAIVVFLALTTVNLGACPVGGRNHFSQPVPVSLVEYCLEADLAAGTVQHVSVTDRDVRWFSKGSPEIRVERLRLSLDEIARLRRLSMSAGSTARGMDGSFSIAVDRRPRVRRTVAGRLLPPLAAILAALLVILVSVRRSRPRVRILTRRVERREAWVLVATTIAVGLFIWGTWPDRETVGADRLTQRVRANLVSDVTFTGDTVSWRELGSRTLYSATADDALRKDLERRIVHARNPDRPFEMQHRVRIHRQDSLGWLKLAPWLLAAFFWVLWTRAIRRSCCW